MKSLRDRVAAALYDEGAARTAAPWPDLSPDRQAPWLADADRVIPIVVVACAMVADQRDPEKPGSYLFKRERISSAMKGLFIGAWECPIERDDCFENCGSYGCGN